MKEFCVDNCPQYMVYFIPPDQYITMYTHLMDLFVKRGLFGIDMFTVSKVLPNVGNLGNYCISEMISIREKMNIIPTNLCPPTVN